MNWWTEKRIAQARAMAADGCNAREIGEAIGTSRCAVIGANRRYKIGLPGQSEGVRRQLARDPMIRLRISAGVRRAGRQVRREPEPVRPVGACQLHASTTAYLMGDPPPGRSALDARRT